MIGLTCDILFAHKMRHMSRDARQSPERLTRRERRGHLHHQQDGLRYIYSAMISPAAAKRTALQQYLQTFFGGSLRQMMTALVRDGSWDDETSTPSGVKSIASVRKGRSHEGHARVPARRDGQPGPQLRPATDDCAARLETLRTGAPQAPSAPRVQGVAESASAVSVILPLRVRYHRRTMPRLIEAPSIVQAAGTKPKRIEEFVGRVNSGHSALSVARMRSPVGWLEPGQRPEFEEITIVLRGLVRVEYEGGSLDVRAGQAVVTAPGEWIRYSTPEEDGAEYVAVCLPAFSPDTVHRDS